MRRKSFFGREENASASDDPLALVDAGPAYALPEPGRSTRDAELAAIRREVEALRQDLRALDTSAALATLDDGVDSTRDAVKDAVARVVAAIHDAARADAEREQDTRSQAAQRTEDVRADLAKLDAATARRAHDVTEEVRQVEGEQRAMRRDLDASLRDLAAAVTPLSDKLDAMTPRFDRQDAAMMDLARDLGERWSELATQGSIAARTLDAIAPKLDAQDASLRSAAADLSLAMADVSARQAQDAREAERAAERIGTQLREARDALAAQVDKIPALVEHEHARTRADLHEIHAAAADLARRLTTISTLQSEGAREHARVREQLEARLGTVQDALAGKLDDLAPRLAELRHEVRAAADRNAATLGAAAEQRARDAAQLATIAHALRSLDDAATTDDVASAAEGLREAIRDLATTLGHAERRAQERERAATSDLDDRLAALARDLDGVSDHVTAATDHVAAAVETKLAHAIGVVEQARQALTTGARDERDALARDIGARVDATTGALSLLLQEARASLLAAQREDHAGLTIRLDELARDLARVHEQLASELQGFDEIAHAIAQARDAALDATAHEGRAARDALDHTAAGIAERLDAAEHAVRQARADVLDAQDTEHAALAERIEDAARDVSSAVGTLGADLRARVDAAEHTIRQARADVLDAQDADHTALADRIDAAVRDVASARDATLQATAAEAHAIRAALAAATADLRARVDDAEDAVRQARADVLDASDADHAALAERIDHAARDVASARDALTAATSSEGHATRTALGMVAAELRAQLESAERAIHRAHADLLDAQASDHAALADRVDRALHDVAATRDALIDANASQGQATRAAVGAAATDLLTRIDEADRAARQTRADILDAQDDRHDALADKIHDVEDAVVDARGATLDSLRASTETVTLETRGVRDALDRAAADLSARMDAAEQAVRQARDEILGARSADHAALAQRLADAADAVASTREDMLDATSREGRSLRDAVENAAAHQAERLGSLAADVATARDEAWTRIGETATEISTLIRGETDRAAGAITDALRASHHETRAALAERLDAVRASHDETRAALAERLDTARDSHEETRSMLAERVEEARASITHASAAHHDETRAWIDAARADLRAVQDRLEETSAQTDAHVWDVFSALSQAREALTLAVHDEGGSLSARLDETSGSLRAHVDERVTAARDAILQHADGHAASVGAMGDRVDAAVARARDTLSEALRALHARVDAVAEADAARVVASESDARSRDERMHARLTEWSHAAERSAADGRAEIVAAVRDARAALDAMAAAQGALAADARVHADARDAGVREMIARSREALEGAIAAGRAPLDARLSELAEATAKGLATTHANTLATLDAVRGANERAALVAEGAAERAAAGEIATRAALADLCEKVDERVDALATGVDAAMGRTHDSLAQLRDAVERVSRGHEDASRAAAGALAAMGEHVTRARDELRAQMQPIETLARDHALAIEKLGARLDASQKDASNDVRALSERMVVLLARLDRQDQEMQARAAAQDARMASWVKAIVAGQRALKQDIRRLRDAVNDAREDEGVDPDDALFQTLPGELS